MTDTTYVKTATSRRPIYDKLVFDPNTEKGKFLLEFINSASEEILFEILRESQKKPKERDVHIDFAKKTPALSEVIGEKDFVNLDPKTAAKSVSMVSGDTCLEAVTHEISRCYIIVELQL